MRKLRSASDTILGDRQLKQSAKALFETMREAQHHLTYKTLRLRITDLKVLAQLIIEFAEDIQFNLGIWAAYEGYNREFFGASLPFSETNELKGLHRDRVRHFLWIMYQELDPGRIISPRHSDLETMSNVVCAFLREAVQDWPPESGVADFLRLPNDPGWAVKRKLVWLGTKSYLFRLQCERYVHEHGRSRSTVEVVDDFLCEYCSRWSGLGPVDILAAMLPLGESERREIRGWSLRHESFYRINAVSPTRLNATNIISDQPYNIRIDMPDSPFEVGHIVYGCLVPWRGDWYWSGEQTLWRSDAIKDVEQLRQDMKRKDSAQVCQFWPEYEAQVRQQCKELHERSHKRWKTDLKTFANGLELAASWQREMKAEWAARPAEEQRETMRRHGLRKPEPNMAISREFLESEDGIGVFLNPDEGQEIFSSFSILTDALKRRGRELTEQEEQIVIEFVDSESISPGFVHRVVAEYGSESIRSVFRLPESAPDYWLNHLLRSRKGHFYRKRFPTLAVL